MIELKREPFDSGLWNKKVFKLHLDGSCADQGKLSSLLEQERPDIVFAFTPFAQAGMEALENLGFHLMSIRSTYTFPSGAALEAKPVSDPFTLVSLADGRPIVSDEEVEQMAKTIGGTSRYFHDRRIPNSDALKLYVAWIRNSLFNGYASEAFLIRRAGRLVGLETLKIRDRVGSIDLIGISPEHQNAGLGSRLFARAIRYCQANGIQDILVVTEGENVQANVFYQRKGGLLQSQELVYHRHF